MKAILLILLMCVGCQARYSAYPFCIDKDESTLGDYGLFAKITVIDYGKPSLKTFDPDMSQEYNGRIWREGSDFPERKNFK